jgi:hypothetical protein
VRAEAEVLRDLPNSAPGTTACTMSWLRAAGRAAAPRRRSPPRRASSSPTRSSSCRPLLGPAADSGPRAHSHGARDVACCGPDLREEPRAAKPISWCGRRSRTRPTGRTSTLVRGRAPARRRAAFRGGARLALLEPTDPRRALRVLRVRRRRTGALVLDSPELRALVAEFDRAWGARVVRTRDILETAGVAELNPSSRFSPHDAACPSRTPSAWQESIRAPAACYWVEPETPPSGEADHHS